jgi:hypothetical protein
MLLQRSASHTHHIATDEGLMAAGKLSSRTQETLQFKQARKDAAEICWNQSGDTELWRRCRSLPQ